MRRFVIPALVVTLTLTVFCPVATAQNRGGGNGGGQGNGGNGNAGNTCGAMLIEHLDTLPVETLSAGEVADITFLREEEKLARDVYATLALNYSIPIFSNIARAEQRHMDFVAELLERHGITDPVSDDSIGVFTDPEIGDLYTGLVAAGESSLEQALLVGATIEDMDIADLNAMIADATSLDVAFIGHNLASGSRNHLRGFARALAASGYAPYAAQYLDQDEVDSIIASGREGGVVYDEYGDVLATCSNENGGGNGRGGDRRRGPGGESCPNAS
jgi:hypothetical protein